MSHLTYSIDDGVAALVLDNPPENRIDEQVADELAAAVDAVGRSDAR
ncbi:MAG: enoyl-CoA hydratase, partial [Solirubrobacterales bacterium]|nr:enoyl-CoA hydratase [Solirubrobacterales bacterium]